MTSTRYARCFSRDSKPCYLDRYEGDALDVSRLDEVTAADLEAVCASGLVSVFDGAATVHCDLPPEPHPQWGFEELPVDEFPHLHRFRYDNDGLRRRIRNPRRRKKQ